jgi:hypothetical protein
MEDLLQKYKKQHFHGFQEYAVLELLRMVLESQADSDEEYREAVNTLISDWVKMSKAALMRNLHGIEGTIPIDGDTEEVQSAQLRAIDFIATEMKEVLLRD